MQVLKKIWSKAFTKDMKRFKHDTVTKIALNEVLGLLENQKELPIKNKDHRLIGQWSLFRECHIKPDIILIYRVEGSSLFLARIGSHSDLF